MPLQYNCHRIFFFFCIRNKKIARNNCPFFAFKFKTDLLVSIFKYSIATWVNFIIYGASLLLVAWFIPADTWGQLDIFISTSTLIMNICILGLDQSFMRFFNEPPSPLDKRGLLGNCFGISAICLVVTAVFCCIVCPQQVLGVFFSTEMPNIYLLYLFVNAFMAMIGRYVNLVYRMAGNIKLYTLESVLMQFFTKVFFVLGVFFSTDLDFLIIFTVCGMSAFGLVFLFVVRQDITLSPKVLFTKANRQILPYGLALMPTAVMLWLNSLLRSIASQRKGRLQRLLCFDCKRIDVHSILVLYIFLIWFHPNHRKSFATTPNRTLRYTLGRLWHKKMPQQDILSYCGITQLVISYCFRRSSIT